ncbi:MAG: serine/threonine-protein phosphatase [Clostridia bacterium]|nr:serine/threonine-protein phosphatase [Clostridia bacterium]
MIAGGYTLLGVKHEINQDSYLIKDNGELKIYAVADGMGGHAAGDLASAIAIKVLETSLGEFSEDAIRDAALKANEQILSVAKTKEEYKGMGTTVALCMVKGNELFLSHIGDSRIYIDKGDGDFFITTDHSVVQQLVERGEISASEAKDHKMKNIITRALGVESSVEMETEITDLTDDTVIVICSDGVSNAVEDETIVAIAKENSPEKAAEILCETAKKQGSTDDITAIVVKVRGEEK